MTRNNYRSIQILAGVVAFAAGFGSALLSAPAEREDYRIRGDFFAGFRGDQQAMDRAMAATEAILEQNPNHAEAMVWHGGGLYFRAGQKFRDSNFKEGMQLYSRAMSEMDRAVELQPDSIGVRIPRGAVLLSAAAFQEIDGRVRGEIRKALYDYEHVYRLQRDQLTRLGEHPLGQLLLGLGDGYSKLGEQVKAKAYFDQIEQFLPGTAYAERAARWRQNGKLTAQESACVGCHAGN